MSLGFSRMLWTSSMVALRRTYSSWSTSLRFAPSSMRWMTYSSTLSCRPDRLLVPKSLSQKDRFFSATFALNLLTLSALPKILPEDHELRQRAFAPRALGGYRCLYSPSCREHAFLEAYPFCGVLRRSVEQTFRSPELRARVAVIEATSTEKERSDMSPQSRLVAGILLILVPTVEIGGVSILSLLISDPQYTQNHLRQDLWRAGHAHAGVWLVLALVALRYVDEANLSEGMRWVVRLSLPAAAVLMPLGFFLSVLPPEVTEPNGIIYLTYVAGVVLAVGLLVLGAGLIRGRPTERELA